MDAPTFRAGFSDRDQALLDRIHQTLSPLYLVGGAVRERLLDHAVSGDLDLLTPLSLSECRQLLGTVGFTNLISGRKPNSLIIPSDSEGRMVEISTYRHRANQAATVEEDLANRDLAINAMAFKWPGGPFLDPFDGWKDLERRRLRLINGQHTLEGDPIRALRLFRFAIQLGALPHPDDLALAQQTSLARASQERLRTEMDRIFSQALTSDQDQQLVQQIFEGPLGQEMVPEIKPLFLVPCRFHPQKSVWEHTLSTLLNLSLPPREEETPIMDLRWSAWLHETGKATTARIDAQGIPEKFPAYAEESTRIVTHILNRMKFTNRRKRRILSLIQNHDHPFPPTDRALKRLLKQQVPLAGLLRLIQAHRTAGMPAPSENNDREEEFQRILTRCRTLQHTMAGPSPNDLAISGGDLLEMARRPPGPWMRELQLYLVEWIREDRRRNSVDDMEKQARRWLQEHPPEVP